MDNLLIKSTIAICTIVIGFASFIFLLNRQLPFSDIARGQIKRIIAIFFLLGAGSILVALAVLLIPGQWLRPYAVFICLALIFFLAGEIRFRLQKSKYRGDHLIQKEPLKFDDCRFRARESNIFERAQPITTMDLDIYKFEVAVAMKAVSAAGTLKVISMSDFHIHPNLPFCYYEAVIDQANQEEPDLVFLPGDFVTDLDHSAGLEILLSRIKARYGVFATLGNHDYWAGPETVLRKLENSGVQVATNRCIKLSLPGHASNLVVMICGNDDPWGENPWKPPDFDAGSLYIMLSHTPDNIYQLSRYPFTAIFSGHCHGGQFRIPGFGSIILPSGYGRRFDHGHYVFGSNNMKQRTHLFVSAGVGVANPALRFYCHPDIFVVNFRISPL